MARRGDIKGSGEPLCPRARPLTRSAAPSVQRCLHRGYVCLFGWVLAALAPTLTPVLPAAYAQAPTGGELSAQLATLEAQIRELEQGLPTAAPEATPAAAPVVRGRLAEARALVGLRSFVAAAAVLREGQAATERELRDFAAQRLADFKVPRKIVLLAEIPKGATGKLQRIGLAAKLGLA